MSLRREARLKVQVDAARRDCFATVSSTVVSQYFNPVYSAGGVPQVVPVKVEKEGGRGVSATTTSQPSSPTAPTENNGNEAGTVARHRFVGVLALQPHNTSKAGDDAIVMGPSLLQALDLDPGTFVCIQPLRPDCYRDALNVFVSPHTVDDSEVVEHNQSAIINNLLRNLRVVYEGLTLTVPVNKGLQVRLDFGKINFVPTAAGTTSPKWQCATLTQGTELFVSTRMRKKEEDGDKNAEPKPAVIRVGGGSTDGAFSSPSQDSSVKDDKKLKQPDSSSSSLLVVSKSLADAYNWSDGLAVGLLDSTTITNELLNPTSSNTNATTIAASSSPSVRLGDDLLQPASAAEAEQFSVMGSSALRSALRLTVRIQDGSAHCFLHGVADAEVISQQTCFIFPHPPSQVQSTSLTALAKDTKLQLLSKYWTESPFSGTNMSSVYGSSFLREQLGAPIFAQLAGWSSNRSRNDGGGGVSTVAGAARTITEASNVLIAGGRGSGKTSLAQWVATTSRRLYDTHLVGIDFRGKTADSTVMKDVKQLFFKAALNAPSLVVLDNLDAAFPADQEGNPNAKSVSKSAATTLRDLITSSASVPFLLDDYLGDATMRSGGGGFSQVLKSLSSGSGGASPSSAPVVIIATCSSKDNLHEFLRESPKTFGTLLKTPALTLESKVTLLTEGLRSVAREGVTSQENTNSPPSLLSPSDLNKLALRLDNYAVHDVVQVCKRSVRAFQQQKSSSSGGDSSEKNDLKDIVNNIIGNYQPLAHQGINLLNKNSGGDDGGGSSDGGPLKWSDVGAMKDAKKAMYNALVLPTKFPQLFATLPLKTRSGVLLYGPPGCGKTFVLQALVAAHKLNCIVVNGPEILDKYIGASEQKVRDVFERAQAASPCILFFDEFDSIAPQRGHDNTGVTDRVVNQLLCYLDGVEARSSVYVVAASSRPDLIDAALLRPGRLDKAIYCRLPNMEERMDILRVHSKKIKVDPSVDIKTLAEMTENWTGADLAGLVSTVNVRVVNRHMEEKTAAARAAAGGAAAASSSSSATVGTDEDVAMFEVFAPVGAARDAKRKLMENIKEAAPSLKKQLNLTSSSGVGDDQSIERSRDRHRDPSVSAGKGGSSGSGWRNQGEAHEEDSGATMEDFLLGLQDTRPSIAAKELRMYSHIYTKFSNSREKKGTSANNKSGAGAAAEGAAEDEEDFGDRPGQRTTMA